jgi:cyclic beta-1,2-glucan synthetase
MIFLRWSITSPGPDGGLLHADPYIESVNCCFGAGPAGCPADQPHAEDGQAVRPVPPKIVNSPWRVRVLTPQPRAHFLSNGKYGLLITSSGAGYSTWDEIDLTRWRADATLNDWGQWIYVQDLDSGALWSAGMLPARVTPQSRDVFFSAHMAEFRRRDGDISLTMEITVSPEHDIEIRRLSLTNHGTRPRRLRLTSYAEVVLSPQSTDARHPAFNKMFIESEYVPDQRALLFRRRPRSGGESPLYLAHAVVIEGEQPRKTTAGMYETDRLHFLGRGRTVRQPVALRSSGKTGGLTGTTGATLDPVLALGQEIKIQPHGRVELAFLTAAASDRAEILAQVSRYRSWSTIGRAFEQARSLAEAEMRQTGLQAEELQRIQVLFSALVYPSAALRAGPEILAENRKGQPGLWAYSISGDFPILLVEVGRLEELALVQELLQVHLYWRKREFKIDLVILNTRGTGYDQELNNAVHRLLERMDSEGWLNRRGGIFLVSADLMAPGDRVLLETAARVVLYGEKGDLETQLDGVEALHRLPTRLPAFLPVRQPDPEERTSPPGPPVAVDTAGRVQPGRP